MNPDRLAHRLLKERPGQRITVLLLGAMGTGKSSLARRLAGTMAARGVSVECLSADPGSPQFGVPGAVCLARWADGDFQVTAMEPLCSLNAVRFRLPLMRAVASLYHTSDAQVLLVDAPGTVRGFGAEEILDALVEAVRPQMLIYLYRPGQAEPIEAQLATLSCPVERLQAHAEAKRPSRRARDGARTALWQAYLQAAAIVDVDLSRVAVLGTPPRDGTPLAWQGLQVALQREGELLGMGQVLDRKGDSLRVRVCGDVSGADVLLVRDARLDTRGTLRSDQPPAGAAADDTTMAPEAVGRTTANVGEGAVSARLINGVFGDPLLELRLRGQSSRMLFDLGDAGLMTRRMLHKVTDVFITHAHFDHVCGFLDMLRARMTGAYPPLRIYGPEGITTRILAAVNSIEWDRIGDAGPELHLGEVCGETLHWQHYKVGKGGLAAHQAEIEDAVLLRRPECCVRYAMLDHGIPVLAFSLELAPRYRIRKARLAASGRPPGPWLNELKLALEHGALDARIALPDGTSASAALLRRELVDTAPGEKLCYATDFADTPGNRHTLAALARHADLFFCEATFVEEDVLQARATSHLTARACGEIAAAAGVKRLVPFHFSKRYSSEPQRVYEQVAASCGSVRISRLTY